MNKMCIISHFNSQDYRKGWKELIYASSSIKSSIKVVNKYELSYFYSYCYYQGKNLTWGPKTQILGSIFVRLKVTETKSGQIKQNVEVIYWLQIPTNFKSKSDFVQLDATFSASLWCGLQMVKNWVAGESFDP